MIRTLKMLGDDVDGENGEWLKSPLISVVATSEIEAVKLLKELSADVNRRDENGCNAMHFLVELNNARMPRETRWTASYC